MSEPNFNTKTYIVPAGGSYTVAAVGNFITNLTATTVAGSLTLVIGGGRETRFDGSDTYLLENGETFTEITLKNTTGGAVTVTVGIGQGEIRVANAVTVSGTVATLEAKAATLATVADVALTNGAATLLSASSSTRREVLISNPAANAVTIRIGDANVTATRGIELGVGGTIVLTTSAGVYAFVAAAAKTAGVMTVSD